MQSSPSSEGEVLQGPLTPFSKGSTPGRSFSHRTRSSLCTCLRSSNHFRAPLSDALSLFYVGWRPSPLTRFRVKATPVAYPFNLVKPNSAHGDVTLHDINQRIKSPSPRPTPRRLPSKEEQKSPAQSGSGLSGKAVVACTKIHTEGNGTITIMRTRG